MLTYSQSCKTSINLKSAKQGIFSVIPDTAVHMNFAVNIARFFRTPILYNICNHMLHVQNCCSKKSRNVLESLFYKDAGLWPTKNDFSTGVFL